MRKVFRLFGIPIGSVEYQEDYYITNTGGEFEVSGYEEVDEDWDEIPPEDPQYGFGFRRS